MTNLVRVELTIPGRPVPYARTRHGKQGVPIVAPKQRAYRKHVAACMQRAMLEAKLREPMLGALDVELDVHVEDMRCGDASNYAKLVEDVGNKLLWVDDVQIVRLLVRRWLDADNPRTRVVVRQLKVEMDAVIPQSKRRA